MDIKGRPDSINDVLASYRSNGTSWYTWEKYDAEGNKIPNKDRMQYKYLKVIDGGDKPTEDEVNGWLTKAQSDFDTDKTNTENKKASGKQKLKDLGLDDDEIKALTGV
tara:strand:+ start:473 stop:796 length:324 start_codon:yes stop_codon:yes gene_type:complete